MKLVVNLSDGSERQEYELTSKASIGRDSACDIVLTSSGISRHHAEIGLEDGNAYVRDLGSKNGTLLNGTKISAEEPTLLEGRDILEIGGWQIHFVNGVSAQAAPGPSPEKVLIGRSKECNVRINDPGVSRKHAMATSIPNGWIVEDLDSANGTFLNDKQITRARARYGDVLRIGLHTFVLTNEGFPKSKSEVQPVSLRAQNLSQVVWVNDKPLKLLHHINLFVQPGELVAILGGTGAGKSTLLMALNGYQPASSGSVTVNDIKLYDNPDLFRSSIGYVPQSDIVHSELTCFRALYFAAKLRLPSDTNTKEIEAIVDVVLKDLGLSHRKNSPIRVLSGGERKRVNIGVELLTKPSLLFLDEPTTGLDPSFDRKVVKIVRQLADGGRTVIYITHNPGELHQFDKVVVLARGGYLAFFGTPAKALEFFDVKTFVDLYDVLEDGTPGAVWAEKFERFKPQEPERSLRPRGRSRAQLFREKLLEGTSGLGQFFTLLRRNWELIRSDSKNLLIWALQAPLVAIIIASMYGTDIFATVQPRDSSTGRIPLNNAPVLLFLTTFSVLCFSLFNASKDLIKERSVYEREKHVCLRIMSYLGSKIVILTTVAILQSLVVFLVIGMRVQFGLSLEGNLFFLLMMVLGSMNALMCGLLISASVSSSDQATTASAGFLMMQIIFSGLQPLSHPVLNWISYLTMTRWTYGGVEAVVDLKGRLSQLHLDSQITELEKTSISQAIVAQLLLFCATFAATYWVMTVRDQPKYNRR